MTEQTEFLKNCWYVAALSSEVEAEALFHRRILGTSVLLYRKADGTPVALHDRCPHRFAPLSMGKRDGDEIVCPYHALKFDCSGSCTHNPHGPGKIPQAARVRSFALEERYGFIWIWMGEAEADPALLPDFSPLDEQPASSVAYTYMSMPVNYELIIDNVMDLSHVDHVHTEIITTRGQLTPLVPPVHESEDSITARWEWEQTPPIFILNEFLPQPQEEARHFVQVNWFAPANIQLSIGAVQNDGPLDLDNCVGQYDLHSTTPESATSTHYFFATRRNHLVEDADYNAMKIKAMHDAFENEDGPLIEAAQREMATTDFFGLDPVLMTNDVAPVRVRRKLAKMIETERAS